MVKSKYQPALYALNTARNVLVEHPTRDTNAKVRMNASLQGTAIMANLTLVTTALGIMENCSATQQSAAGSCSALVAEVGHAINGVGEVGQGLNVGGAVAIKEPGPEVEQEADDAELQELVRLQSAEQQQIKDGWSWCKIGQSDAWINCRPHIVQQRAALMIGRQGLKGSTGALQGA